MEESEEMSPFQAAFKSRTSNSDSHTSDSDKFDSDNYDADIFLILTIMQANGIDSLNTDPINRIYKVVSWIEPENKFTAPEVYGFPDPVWMEQIMIPFKNPMDCRSLYLEVIRTRSKSDPGTSTGEVLVGKVKIPWPRLSSQIQGSFRLTRLEGPGCKHEGSVTLAMELREIESL